MPCHPEDLTSRVCPFISSGKELQLCLGEGCVAARYFTTGEGRVLFCTRVDRIFYDDGDDLW